MTTDKDSFCPNAAFYGLPTSKTSMCFSTWTSSSLHVRSLPAMTPWSLTSSSVVCCIKIFNVSHAVGRTPRCDGRGHWSVASVSWVSHKTSLNKDFCLRAWGCYWRKHTARCISGRTRLRWTRLSSTCRHPAPPSYGGTSTSGTSVPGNWQLLRRRLVASEGSSKFTIVWWSRPSTIETIS